MKNAKWGLTPFFLTPFFPSDIDLAVFSHSVNKMGIEKKITILSKTREKVGSEVEIHLFSEKCLKNARPTNFYGYILETGKKIYSRHA